MSPSQPALRCDMKHQIRIDPQAKLVLVCFRGRVNLSNLLDVLRAFPEEGFEVDYRVLWDARAIGETVLRPGDLERLMRHYSELVDNGDGHAREAALVGRPLDYFVAQLYKALARRSGYEVGVYWRLEEALDYLGLEELPEALEQ